MTGYLAFIAQGRILSLSGKLPTARVLTSSQQERQRGLGGRCQPEGARRLASVHTPRGPLSAGRFLSRVEVFV
jgi:hypothetical protein